MKKRFSIGKALEAPFVLLRTQPLALFGWGMLRMVLTIATFSILLPMFAAFPAFGDAQPDTDRLMQIMAPLQGGVQLLNLVSIVLSVVIWTAAMRAAMAPRGTKDRFLFLRLGMDEVYVAVVMVVLVIGLYLAAFVLMLVGALLAFILWHVNEMAAVLVTIAYALGAFVAILWGAGRVTLLAPASLALHTVAFEQGWKLGKGQGWRLATTGLLAWLILMAISIVIGAIVLAVFFGIALGLNIHLPNPDDIHSFADLAEVGRPFLIPAAVLALPLALFDGFTHAVFGGPVASACKQLMESDEAGVLANEGDADPTPAL